MLVVIVFKSFYLKTNCTSSKYDDFKYSKLTVISIRNLENDQRKMRKNSIVRYYSELTF